MNRFQLDNIVHLYQSYFKINEIQSLKSLIEASETITDLKSVI